MMRLLLATMQLGFPDTLVAGTLDQPPPANSPIDSLHLGPPQVRIPTRQGTALVWLLRSADSFFVAASIPDSTFYWGDDLVISLDTRGDAAPAPEHDDFQFYIRRTLDSSVIYRGRDGKWQAPQDDPDWRIGEDRSGGGWEISGRENSLAWGLLLRMDPAWFSGEGDRLPRLGFRIYDDAPSGWFAWPAPEGLAHPVMVERSPSLWVPVLRHPPPLQQKQDQAG